MRAVYLFFKDKVDTANGVKLFSTKNEKKFENMLAMVAKGYASDPENMTMYIPKTDMWGRKVIDKDGLTLY